jgi:hypothetical protein
MNTEQTAGWAQNNYKLLVERAGGIFVGVNDGAVLFRASPDSPVCSLYPFALRSVTDVQLALKSVAERKKESQWEFEPAKKEK